MSQHGDQYSRQCDICLKFVKNEKALIDHKMRTHQLLNTLERVFKPIVSKSHRYFHMLEAYMYSI